MKVGDLVKMRLGYSAPGIVIKLWSIGDPVPWRNYAKVMWSDYGEGLEKVRDLEVINESR
jgi:hypothetical protein